jgi:hypothetical protein
VPSQEHVRAVGRHGADEFDLAPLEEGRTGPVPDRRGPGTGGDGVQATSAVNR